jgi:hypothetical protein
VIYIWVVLALLFTLFTVTPLANAVEEFTGSFVLRLLACGVYGYSVGFIIRLLLQ